MAMEMRMASRSASRSASLALLAILPVPAFCTPYAGDGLYGRLDIHVVHLRNVSRAWIRDDRVADSISQLALGGGYVRRLGGNGRFLLTGYAGYDAHETYDELNRFRVSVQARYEFQVSRGFSALHYGVGMEVTGFRYRDSVIRDGTRVRFNVDISKRLGRHWMTDLAWEYRRRNARNEVFDTRHQEITLGLVYRPGRRVNYYLDYRYLQGDLVSSASGPRDSPASASLADKRVPDPVFVRNCVANCEYWSYRYTGSGKSATAGVVIDLNETLSLDLALTREYRNADAAGVDYSDFSAMVGLIWLF